MSVDPWAGLHVAGLCVGVGNYRYLDKLDNAVRDAEEVNKRLNSVPNCYSALLENPALLRELLRKIIQCLQEPGLREKPPELFLFYYAGHAIQLNSKVYLVPSCAKLDNRSMYDAECLTLDKLLETLRDTLDLPVRHKMHKPRSIAFLVVLDCCRNSIDDALACEPAPQSMPNNTTILFSCSRTKRADDGPSGGHSPFAQALLHAKHGFFAKGATLEDAFRHIGAGALDSQACGQKPTIIGPAGAIPPQFRIWPSPDTQTNPFGGAGDSTLCNSSDSSGSSTSSATGPSVIGRAEGKKRADNPQEGSVSKKQRCEVPNEPISSGLPGASGGKRADSKSADDAVTKKPFTYDVFISHAWDKDDEGRNNHERAKRLNVGLKHLGMKTWFDEEQMQGNILNRMAHGIRGSAVVLICVTRRYAQEVGEEAGNRCKREFEFATQRRTDVFMLPVVMEESMTDTSKWDGILGLVLGRHSYHKLTSDADHEFDKAVSEIAAAVRRKIDENLLPDLQQATSSILQDAMCSREPSLTPSDQSDMSTAPQSPSSPSEVMGIYVESTVSEFRDDMKKFMRDFLHQRRLCELLLVAFMRDMVAPSCDVKIARNLETWQEKCEDLDANLVICFNKIMRTLKPSILKEQLNYEFSDVNEKNHTSVFVINWMVQHSPWALNETKIGEWLEEVVNEFDPNNADSAEGFLERAEKFLQKAVKGEKWGIKILGKVIETNSYVAFFRMEALAALLLREYCSQQKISHAHQQKQHDAQKTAHNPQCTLPLSIGLMVSSSNWHLSFTKGEVHSACMSEIAWHLQRIACLPTKTLENNEHSLSELEAVEWERIYNLKKASPGVSASGDPAERALANISRASAAVREYTHREYLHAYLEPNEVWYHPIMLTIGNAFPDMYCFECDIPLMQSIRRDCRTDVDRVVWGKRDSITWERGPDDAVSEYELNDRDTPMSLGMESNKVEYCEVYSKYERMYAQSTDATDEETDGNWLDGTDASDEERDGNWLDGLGSPRAPQTQATVAEPAEGQANAEPSWQAQANAEPAWQAHGLGVDEYEVY